MDNLRVYADFHNADPQGRVRLNCVGTVEDLARCQIKLEDALEITLYSEDLEVEGRVQYSRQENVWVAVIDWNAIREVTRGHGMKEECDFSKAERGKFYRPDAKLNLPVYLSEEVQAFVQELADKRKTDISTIVNELLRDEMHSAKSSLRRAYKSHRTTRILWRKVKLNLPAKKMYG